MKKVVSMILSGLMLVSVLVSCAPAADQLDPAITLVSSDAKSRAEWLSKRLDVIPDDVILGIGSNENYGVDMSDFDEEGYIVRAIGDEVLLFGVTSEGLDCAVREYAKSFDAGTTATLDIVYGEGAWIEELTIDGRDIAEYTIIYEFDEEIFNHPTSRDHPTYGNTKYAAEEFQRLMEIATGIVLPIEKISETKVTDKFIKIEYYTEGDLGTNGGVYKVENGNVYMKGVGRANGCANAVYHFFEKCCGWDGLIFGDSRLNEAEHLDIPDGINTVVDPMFDSIRMRKVYYDLYDTDKGEFSLEYRGWIAAASHSIEKWSGVSIMYYNMCYNDESIFLNTYDKIYTHILNAVESGQKIGEKDLCRIDIGMADALKFCKCKNCLKLLKVEATNAAGIIQFGNRIIENLYDEGLGGIVFTVFAYHGSNIPPKTIKPHEDLWVTFVNDGACVNHSLRGTECTGVSNSFGPGIYGSSATEAGRTGNTNNSDFAEWLEGWAEITEHLYFYFHYLTNNFRTYSAMSNLYDDIHYMYELGIDGFHPEAPYRGEGLGRLRFQLWAAVIWNPEATEAEYEVMKDEIMQREYGDGWEYVEQFIDLLDKTEREGECWHCWLYADMIPLDGWDTNAYANYAPKMEELLLEAKRLACIEKHEKRLNALLYEVYYRECFAQYYIAEVTEDEPLMDYLAGRYDLFVEALYASGLCDDPEALWARKGYIPGETIHDEAAAVWAEKRESLIPTESTQN